jgi:hypothetical protein
LSRQISYCRLSHGMREKQMAEPSGNKDARHRTPDARPQKSREGGKAAVGKAVSDFADNLSDEHRMLVVLKAQLYGGSWEPMLDDLRNRLAGKPYIFKLVNRIEDDIARIEQMRKFETEHNIDLADYVDLP